MRRFYVLEAEVCSVCTGFGAIDNQAYNDALERFRAERKQLSTVALQAIYGPEVLPCPNECEFGIVYKRIPLKEALDYLMDQDDVAMKNEVEEPESQYQLRFDFQGEKVETDSC